MSSSRRIGEDSKRMSLRTRLENIARSPDVGNITACTAKFFLSELQILHILKNNLAELLKEPLTAKTTKSIPLRGLPLRGIPLCGLP